MFSVMLLIVWQFTFMIMRNFDQILRTPVQFKHFQMRKTLARKLHFHTDHNISPVLIVPECMNMRLAIFSNIQCKCCEVQRRNMEDLCLNLTTGEFFDKRVCNLKFLVREFFPFMLNAIQHLKCPFRMGR